MGLLPVDDEQAIHVMPKHSRYGILHEFVWMGNNRR